MSIEKSSHVDRWVWGTETILWGFKPDHDYTLKVLEPLVGRPGCLSLQYHNRKTESWITWQGIAWGLLVIEDTVCTRIMRSGDIQAIDRGVIHRLMGLSPDCKVIEPSTPDHHAADKNQPKDVIRLHCVLGRDVIAPRDAAEAVIVAQAIKITEEAIACVEAGKLPPEYGAEILARNGAGQI